MLIDLLDLRYCLHNKKKNILLFSEKNLHKKYDATWFTKGAPGFLSRFHLILLNKPGAGRFTERAPGFLSRFYWQDFYIDLTT